MAKKDSGAQHFKCKECGHDWVVGAGGLPIHPHCPRCGTEIDEVAALIPKLPDPEPTIEEDAAQPKRQPAMFTLDSVVESAPPEEG